MPQPIPEQPQRQRIDKWLWHARVVRTRTDAAKLVESGHARLNGQRVTAPGHSLRIGDVVTLVLDRRVRILEVMGFCEKRGGSADAVVTYREVTHPAAQR
jgi:ribosome-associated heat shock protein Hsp15